ncbi:MAG: phospho-N-acetylmuramoyl-pentapeptide-transferase [Candidatus Omnitrophica bacterium]|nr:phospho-N-acetylmuramoyl-pentapeptide-transferase [Candidatus Omnitrophota bacterium]MCM8807187.1 phospho-N-acetylmuramoyl-pentapeptide-transferase [Candidatus Omnitrophota bacterium]
MLYKFLYSFKDYWFGFNIFRYVTVRASLSIFTSLLFSILFGRKLINKLKNFCHPNMLDFREEKKEKTPTMGGILILGSLLTSTILWADLNNLYILLLVFITISLGLVGFFDDYKKLKYKSHKGVRPLIKVVSQMFIGFIIGVVLVYNQTLNFNTSLYIPFFKKIVIPLAEYFILFTVFIIVATSNAVNLTDGMDGLAIGLVMTVSLAYAIISYVVSNINFAKYLNVPFVKGAEEATVFSSALVGACLGFLWFNCYPAEIFMGDTGSLPLGGIVGLLAIIVKQELSLIFVGGIFLVEALSVIIQVISFKKRKKRVFLMTPIHHHFELKGIPEPKVVVRFWIIGIILALFTIITLKIR